MSLVIYLAPLVAVVGLLLFLLASNAKAVEVGKILLFVGALGTVLLFASKGFAQEGRPVTDLLGSGRSCPTTRRRTRDA